MLDLQFNTVSRCGADAMIIDAHNHIGKDKGGAVQTIPELKKRMKAYGIDRAVVFPFDEEVNLVGASLDLLKYRSDSIMPFLRFDPKRMSTEKLRRLLNEYKFAGVKLHPRAQNFDPIDKRYYGLYKEICNAGKPLLIHTRKYPGKTFILSRTKIKPLYSDPDRIVKLGRDFPDFNIILAHFANMSPYAIKYVNKYKNLYLETSIFTTNFMINRVSRRLAPSKIIFGSDSPYSDSEIELLKIKKSRISRSAVKNILYKNISRLLGLDL